MKVDHRVTVVTAIQQTPVMLGANRDEGQTPRPAKVGIDIRLQTIGTRVQRGLERGFEIHIGQQTPLHYHY
jgi:hypothetical protein